MYYGGQSAIHQGKEGTAMKTRHTLYALALAGSMAAFGASSVCALDITQSGLMVLQRDYQEPIVIKANNVDLNCNHHKITNPANDGTKIGIDVVNKIGVSIRNCTVLGWETGIHIESSQMITLDNNTLSNNKGDGYDINKS